ncbi:tumor necrosis factor receptor superfamily member 6 [Biomphalaria pfeifferi]|uniref:Tumor necrosis factor receptor superfamily member 6 n=1 Tax=Biomphalaria pfeifferi TaxID=112525 RepID=A0AAD8B380_BIOPF|nr:tumor necrosis factor receptor superfamily member 6 [Biomphalaria pfeifferi]
MPARTNVLFCLAVCVFWTQKSALTHAETAWEPNGAVNCQKGQYFNATAANCLPCPENSFMDIENHNCTTCKPCTLEDQDSHEKVLSHCSSTTDAVIRCIDGYFRSTSEGKKQLECLQCGECDPNEVVKDECSDFSDVVCMTPTTPATHSSDRYLTPSNPATHSSEEYMTPSSTPATHSNDEYFDKGVLIACMFLLAMIIIGIIIYIKRTPHFCDMLRECWRGRCRERNRHHYDNELLVVE